MLWILPNLAGAALGMVAAIFASRYLPIDIAIWTASGLCLAGIVNNFLQRLDKRLGELDRIVFSDRRVQSRLEDRLDAKRRRYQWKRAVTLVVGMIGVAGSSIPWAELGTDTVAVLMFALFALAGFNVVGTVILWFESTALDERAADLNRYHQRIEKSVLKSRRKSPILKTQ